MSHTGATQLAGVMGWPVRHSLSPRLHGFWLDRYGIDGAYVPLPVREADFTTALRGLAALGFRGVNVTVPHKQAAFAACDELAECARRNGAVNTISFRDGVIHGRNTDGDGFLRCLNDEGVDPVSGPALVVGAGGAARAVAAALVDVGAEVFVTSRRAEAGEVLAECLGEISLLPWGDREQALGDFSMVVNTTSGGMNGKPELQLGLARAGPALVVADIVYSPRETQLLANARVRGLRTVEGIGMLLHQAVLGFQDWFGVEPVVDDAVRAFVLAE